MTEKTKPKSAKKKPKKPAAEPKSVLGNLPAPRPSRTEQRTTGSVASTRVRVGDRMPDSVEIRSFPDEVYREWPRLREYRYIERENRTYIIEPGERRIIEEIDD